MNGKRKNCLKVIVVFISHLLVSCAQLSVASYHVTLIFPPARYAENNSVVSSNSQHSCQGHYKANGRLTHLQPGSKVNVTWLQLFPFKTVYRIDLRDDSDKTVARLKHEDLNNSKQNSTKHQMIQLPSKFTCVTCTLRLDVWSDTTPYLKPSVFSSCADVQISPLASLEGVTTLHVTNDCWNSSHCSENGICSDTGIHHRECFCNPGWFGRYCEHESLLMDFNEDQITDYIHTNLSGRFQLYHRIEQAKGQIEFVLRVTGSPLVGIGWMPSGSHCQILSPPNSNQHFQSHSKNLPKANDLLLQRSMVDVAKAGVPVKGLMSRYQKELFPHHPHSFGDGDERRHSVFRRILTPASSTPKFNSWDTANKFLPILPYEDQMMTQYRQLFWRKADDEDNFQEMEDSLFNPLIQRNYQREGKLKLNNIFYSNPAYVHHRFDRSTRRLNKTENETPTQRNASDVQYVFLSSSLNRLNPAATVKEKTTQRISSKIFPFDRKVSPRNTPPQGPPGDRNFNSKVENLHPVSCTDLLVGKVLGFRLHIARCSLTDEHPPQLDCTKSQIENILTAAYGFETNGTTTVVFRKKLDGLTNEMMDVVWMTGQKKARHRSLSPGLLLDVPYGEYQLEILGNHAVNFFADGHQNEGRGQPLSRNDCPMVWQSCSQKFNCGFRVVWVVNPESKEIRFIFTSSLNLMAFRWMGIGFSKDAGLAHSDILIVWVGANGQPTVLDSHLSENGTPEIKETQDVFDVSADVDNDDKLIVKFSRNLFTSDDSHDFGFASNSTCAYLFYAYGGVSWDGKRIGHSVEQVFTPHQVCLSSCPGLFQTFHLTMKIDSLQWNENLRHRGTKQYAELKEEIEDLLDDIFDDIDGFDSVDIISFRNGSILVDFLLKLTIPVLRPHDMASKLNILEELTNQVNSTFNSLVASGNLGLKYILDKSYRKMTQLHEASSSVTVKKNLRTIRIGIGVAVALTVGVLLISLYKCFSRRLKTKHAAETSLSGQNVWSINVRNSDSSHLQENEVILTDMLNTPSSARLGRDPVAIQETVFPSQPK